MVTQAKKGEGETDAAKLGGKPFRQIVAKHVAARFGPHGLMAYEEVPFGSSIIGKDRRLDVLVVSERTGQSVGLQAKYQEHGGTTDEKIHYALADCAAMWIPAVVVYGGNGWSPGVKHTLQASRHAVRFDVHAGGNPADTQELDAFLASTFGLWALVLGDRQRVRG